MTDATSRTLIDRDPFTDDTTGGSWFTRGVWPCSFVSCQLADTPNVTAFRRIFTLNHEAEVRIHVTADERYDLFLDGARIGRGPERGAPDCWFFETYDLHLSPGTHTLIARVWMLGDLAPSAQMTVYSGFLCAPEAPDFVPVLGTGTSEWQAKILKGYTFDAAVPVPGYYFAIGAGLLVDSTVLDRGWQRGAGDGWMPAAVRDRGADANAKVEVAPQHLLVPATLPPMIDIDVPPGRVRFAGPAALLGPVNIANTRVDDITAWQALVDDCLPVTVAPRSSWRVIIDLRNYYCAYPILMVSGGLGAVIRMGWAEALYNEPEAQTKGNRNDIDGKYFLGTWDKVLANGSTEQLFETLWWRCGRYVELQVTTADSPVTVANFRLRETRYPLEPSSSFISSDDAVNSVTPIAVRTLQMCAHETYMDCPYYEQLMYIGDTRLEALLTYVLTLDSRLPRKALSIFNASRLPSGLPQSRYPSRVRQTIAPFALLWIAMIHDYARWRNDLPLVLALIPGVRGVLDAFQGYLNADGLVQAPRGWTFMDWVPSWTSGVPPDGDFGVSCVINWLYVMALIMAAELEELIGETEMAARARRRANVLARHICTHFWDSQRGCFADDLAHRQFSEHAQCIAILSGLLTPKQQEQASTALFDDSDLQRTTIYFAHYLFETFVVLNRPDKFFARLGLWLDLTKNGLCTTVEQPEPSRSDCHGWGAHPLYHYYTSILGIRPAAFGFAAVRIAPMLGSLEWVEGRMSHPLGEIFVRLETKDEYIRAQISLPDGLPGSFYFNGKMVPLVNGLQTVVLPLEPMSVSSVEQTEKD
ncbi:hypothetical protein HDU84_007154 [Entophlyctis sp. JEL0112]|nr:hypothetical protein HDU84_007154 [Entophlyctis sp. JEL0112]